MNHSTADAKQVNSAEVGEGDGTAMVAKMGE
jgi:hypothetical protein